jgi:hypothetical protein
MRRLKAVDARAWGEQRKPQGEQKKNPGLKATHGDISKQTLTLTLYVRGFQPLKPSSFTWVSLCSARAPSFSV